MGPIEKLPAYTQVADHIRRAIHLGQYVRGDRLPSEPDLAQQLRVSRVTLREAIRHLEGEGYLKIRRGVRGGLFITRREETGESRLANLRTRWDEIEALFDFRLAVECAAARLAAVRRTAEALERMATAVEALRAGDENSSFRRADSEFHLAVGDASANAYLRKAVEDARAGMFLPLDVIDFSAAWLKSKSPNEHREILEAIEAQNAKRAEAAMAKHLASARKEIRQIIWGGRTGQKRSLKARPVGGRERRA